MHRRLLTWYHRGRLVVFALVALVLLGLGVAHAWSTTRLVTGDNHVTGRVVDSLRTPTDDGTTYRAIVAYRVDGTEYRVTTDRKLDSAPRKGQERDLLVPDGRPDEARPDEFGELWLGTIALLGFGVALVAALVYTVWGRAHLRRRRG